MKSTPKTEAFIKRLNDDPEFANRLQEKANKALDKPFNSQENKDLLAEFAVNPEELNKFRLSGDDPQEGFTTTTTMTTTTTVPCRTTTTTTTTTEVPYLCT